VHSHHPLPGRSHFQQTRQQRNDPLCRMMLLAIPFAASALQCIVNGEKNPFPLTGDAVYHQQPEEDRAMDTGNMHNKFGKDCACGSGDILSDRLTDTQTILMTSRLVFTARMHPRSECPSSECPPNVMPNCEFRTCPDSRIS